MRRQVRRWKAWCGSGSGWAGEDAPRLPQRNLCHDMLLETQKWAASRRPFHHLKLTSQHLYAFHVDRIPLNMAGDGDVMAFMAL
jgi:hypothetical protein